MSDTSPAPRGSGSPYKLDQLGWLQFDRLCGLLLEAEAGLSDVTWRGWSDSRRAATVNQSFGLRNRRIRLRGPVTVSALWIPEDGTVDGRLRELADRVVSLLSDCDRSETSDLLVFTNLDSKPAEAALRAEAQAVGRRLVVLGASQIGASLDRDASIRAALPSVLGLRDLSALIDPEAMARSTFDIPRAQELALVFWATRAYERARSVLEAHRFVVLTGPPEMGKTAIAQMIALGQLTDGWEAHECTDPEQVWKVFDPARRQVFIADDAFGSTEYRPDSAERWALGLGRLLAMLDRDHWLIWTSRPAPLKAGLRRVQRERHAERFPAPGEVLVDASELNLEEKTLILFRHAKARGVSSAARELLRSAGLSIVEHPHFTPERIRRFITDRVQALSQLPADRIWRPVERELSTPTDAMRNSFDALDQEHRNLLVALLDAPAGLIDERELAATVRRHYPGGLSRSPGDLIDRLTDHFLRITPLGIGWVHPSWRDLVIDQLRADAPSRQRFLAACGVDGVMLALSQEGGASGERTLPLLGNDADWDRLGDRVHQLLRSLEPRDVARVLVALDTAVRDVRDPAQGVELKSLAADVLTATRQAWNQSRQPVPPFLLEAWYRLHDDSPQRLLLPVLTVTWAELHPGWRLLERPDRDELARADDWLALAQILDHHNIAALHALGFSDKDRDYLRRLMVTLARSTAPDPELRALADSVLKRIEELVPELAVSAQSASTVAGLAEDLERERWWVPEDIAAPPTDEPVAVRTDFTSHDVDRVLNDL